MRVLALALALALAGGALAQPCIECRDCRTDNCYRVCRSSCPTVQPSNVIVSGDACKYAGQNSATGAARSACESTRRYCNGGRMSPPATVGYGAIGPTSLAQCANIAFGACQQNANNARSWNHPCGSQILNGFSQCSAQQFRSFFEGETRDLCYNAAKSITNVNPGTNQWAGQGAPQPVYRPPGNIGSQIGAQIGGQQAGNIGAAIGSQVGGQIASGIIGSILGRRMAM